MSEICRESTLIEEINELQIDASTKERIIRKAEKIIDENNKQRDYLFNCHHEIDILKIAVTEQAKIIGYQANEIIEKDIHINW